MVCYNILLMKKKWYRSVLFFSLQGISGILRIFPRPFVLGLGSFLGSLVFYVSRREREKALEGLEYVLGNEKSLPQRMQIARRCFMHLGKNLTEILIMPSFSAAYLDKIVKVEGLEKVRPLLEQKKGFLVVSAHLGNWELLAGYFGKKGYCPTVIGRRIYYDKYNDFLVDIRQKMGFMTLYRDGVFRTAVRLLKEGNFIAVLADQDVDSLDGVYIDFLGKPAYTPTGPAVLALTADVPLLPAFIVRDGNRHRILIDDFIYPVRTENKEKDILENTKAWSRVVESYIRRYPEQWVWVHRRWKTKESQK